MRLIVASFVLAAFSFAASASEVSDRQAEPSLTGSALLQERAMHEDIALALAPIKSRKDLDSHVRNSPKSLSPLRHLSPGARKRFLASVTFNEQGITGFSYEDLENELTPSQIYSVLSLFGAQHMTAQIRGARVESEIDKALLDRPVVVPALVPKGGPNDPPSCPTQPCDYAEYKCVDRATCETHTRYICMRTC